MEHVVTEIKRLSAILSWELVIIITLVILAVTFTVNIVLLLIGARIGPKEGFAEVLDTIWKCCKNAGDKFKQLRTTAVIFGVMLTVIILSLLNSNVLKSEPGKEVPDAFWIAFGVVLSAFATAIANLVEKDDQPDKDDQSVKDKEIDEDDKQLDEAIRAIVAQEIKNVTDTSPTQPEPDPSRPLRENGEGATRHVDEGSDSEPHDDDEQARA